MVSLHGFTFFNTSNKQPAITFPGDAIMWVFDIEEMWKCALLQQNIMCSFFQRYVLKVAVASVFVFEL